jgi:hypothetical protein
MAKALLDFRNWGGGEFSVFEIAHRAPAPVQLTGGLFLEEYSRRGVKQTTYVPLVPKLRMIRTTQRFHMCVYTVQRHSFSSSRYFQGTVQKPAA